jgi:hypothetical protein
VSLAEGISSPKDSPAATKDPEGTSEPPGKPGEGLETTRAWSAQDRLGPDEALLAVRPFCSPHHTISDVSA